MTKYYGPTDTKGSRIRATCGAYRITIGYPYRIVNSRSDERCTESKKEALAHFEAAKRLCEINGWNHNFLVGGNAIGTGGAVIYTFSAMEALP